MKNNTPELRESHRLPYLDFHDLNFLTSPKQIDSNFNLKSIYCPALLYKNVSILMLAFSSKHLSSCTLYSTSAAVWTLFYRWTKMTKSGPSSILETHRHVAVTIYSDSFMKHTLLNHMRLSIPSSLLVNCQPWCYTFEILFSSGSKEWIQFQVAYMSKWNQSRLSVSLGFRVWELFMQNAALLHKVRVNHEIMEKLPELEISF